MAASKKLRFAGIGCSHMGWKDVSTIGQHKQVEMVAFCDVDSRHFKYAEKQWPGRPKFSDFRVMLDKMGEDPTALGPGLAIAMITTLYGVLFARLLFIPAANKIMQREQIVRFRNYLVAEGLILMADRKSPRYIQDKMNSYLDPAIHFNIDKARKK